METDFLPIIPIQTGNSQSYLIPNGSRSVLVDTGVPGSSKRILAAAEKAGLKPGDITLIILTHMHYDHAGSAASLKAITGAQVLAHAAEAPVLRQGQAPFPAGTNPFGRVLAFFGRLVASRISRYEPIDPDITITAPFDLGPYGMTGIILPTPGHTAGSICVILYDRFALAGDTLFGIFPNSAFPPFADDPVALISSWRALLETTSCETFFPAHGRPVSRALLQKSLERAENRG